MPTQQFLCFDGRLFNAQWEGHWLLNGLYSGDRVPILGTRFIFWGPGSYSGDRVPILGTGSLFWGLVPILGNGSLLWGLGPYYGDWVPILGTGSLFWGPGPCSGDHVFILGTGSLFWIWFNILVTPVAPLLGPRSLFWGVPSGDQVPILGTDPYSWERVHILGIRSLFWESVTILSLDFYIFYTSIKWGLKYWIWSPWWPKSWNGDQCGSSEKDQVFS